MINEVCDEREGVTYVCDKNSDCVADWCGNGVVGSLEDCDDGQNHRQNDGCTDACAFSCRRDHDCTKLNNPGDCKRYLCEKVMDEGNRGMKCVPTLDRTDPPADLPCKTYECKVALPDDDTRPAFIVHVAHTRENSVMACSDPAKDLENGICYLGECVAPEVCPDCPESCVCLNGTCLCDEPVGGGLGGCHAGHGGSAGHTHGETPAPSRRRLPGTLLVVLGLTLAIVLRRRAGVLVLAALLASPALLTAAPASAQDTATPAANIDFFQPSPHLSDDIVIATNKTLRHLQASSGAMASWALTTLQIKGPTASRVIVRHRVKTDMTMSLGLFGWTEVGMAVPVVLVNDVIEDRSAHLSPRFAGFGDLVLSGKARLINGCGQFLDKHELGFPMPWQSSLGAQLSLSLPTGDEESLFGSNGLVLRPQVVYAALATDRLSLTANFGAALRTAEDHVLGISIGQEITWGAGISYAVRHGHVYVQSGLRSAIPMDFSRIGSAVSNPYELDIWARWIIKDTIQLFAGAGTGPFRPGYGTPDLRFLAGVGTTFRVTGERLRRDMDRDGIEDTWDRCVCSPKVY